MNSNVLNTVEKMIAEKGVRKLTDEERELFWVTRINSQQGDCSLYKCDKCKGKGFYAYLDENGKYKEATCDCMRKRTARKILRDSGLLSFVDSNNSFESFKTTCEWQKRMKEKAIEYVNNFRKQWFFVGGNVGTGKTKLCTTIVAQLLEKETDSLIFIRWASEYSKYTFNKEVEQLNYIKNCGILLLDDFLRVNGELNTAERMLAMDIIDYRYLNNLTTIINSELSYEEIENLDYALASRIYERANGFTLSMKRDKSRNVRKNSELI